MAAARISNYNHGCTPEEMAELDNSYKHLCALRDEVIAMGIMPPIDHWHELNPYLDHPTC